MGKQLVPKENIEIYCHMYCIENVLRELIIDLLKSIDGPRWYKKRLPGDILEKYREGMECERNIKWIQLIPHHPIYYIEFPDLKKIIERADNWKDIFRNIFGSRKDIVTSIISELEPIRNKIAHNRKVTYSDVEIVKGAYTKLLEIIGEKKFDELVIKHTYAMDIWDRLTKLQNEAEKIYEICKNYEPLEKIEVWESIRNEWWFDESYLGHNLDVIVIYFKYIEEYINLPRIRGSGHKIESWVKVNDIETKYTNAQNVFLALSSKRR